MQAPVLKSCAPRTGSPVVVATVRPAGSGVSGTVHAGSVPGQVPVAVSPAATGAGAAAGAAPFVVSGAAATAAGNTGPPCSCLAHASNSAGGTVNTRKRMLECDEPQYSAQNPFHTS